MGVVWEVGGGAGGAAGGTGSSLIFTHLAGELAGPASCPDPHDVKKVRGERGSGERWLRHGAAILMGGVGDMAGGGDVGGGDTGCHINYSRTGNVHPPD